jgi:hypothetical protein
VFLMSLSTAASQWLYSGLCWTEWLICANAFFGRLCVYSMWLYLWLYPIDITHHLYITRLGIRPPTTWWWRMERGPGCPLSVAWGPGLVRFATATHCHYPAAPPRIATYYHPLPRITHPLPTHYHPLPTTHYHPLPRCYPRIAHPPEGVFFGGGGGGGGGRRGGATTPGSVKKRAEGPRIF